MIHKTIASVLLACLFFPVFAQTDSTGKKAEHYIGLQANQLFRQLFNLSNNNSATIASPYLLNYSVVSTASQWGANIGWGYGFDEIKTGDPTNERTTSNNDFFFRIGVEKKIPVSKKWLIGVGADILFDKEKSETISKTNTGFGMVNTTTNNKVSGYGTGARLTLSYYITNRILIGTEATYYFKSQKIAEERKVTTTTQEVDPITGQPRTVTRSEFSDSDDKTKRLQFNVPAVLWLTVKF